MAKQNLDYYSGENFYSDGDVEKEILDIVTSQTDFENMDEVKFPVLYHLSRVRENILNWYPFRENAVGLEIGSGCGAITGLLCRRFSKLVSVELSKQRADINFARHKRLDNLEIWVGNLNDMAFGEQFDYVILNGVFEYSVGFTEGENPCETFLDNIRRLLKPDGVILIAIENRLGLKYFAGAPEDHTDGYFDGIRGYQGNHSVRTFTKQEWKELLRRCGLPCFRFYYPYPDYKFPREIFTDETLEEQKYGSPSWNFTKYRMALFEEREVAADLCREGVMDVFANSFLIEAGRQPLESCVEYVKLSTDRDCHFAISTVIEQKDGVRQVRKSAMTDEAKRHLKKMQTMEGGSAWTPLSGRMEGDSLVYPYLPGKSLAYRAAEAVHNGQIDQVRALVRKVYDICMSAKQRGNGKCIKSQEMSGRERTEFGNVFGTPAVLEDLECIAPANIDLILDNIFEQDGQYYVIDCEWVFDFPVPVLFLLWRTINELYSMLPELENQYAKKELLEEYQISEELSGVFFKWATHFAERYVGANRLWRYSVPEIGISLEEFRQRQRRKEYLISQLFVDTGKGFREEEKLTAETVIQGKGFSAVFDLSGFASVRALRFDPLEGSPCICKIDRERTNVRLTAANASARDEKGDLFLTTDPIYLADRGGQTGKIVITGEIDILSLEEALERANGMLQRKNEKWGLGYWRRHHG